MSKRSFAAAALALVSAGAFAQISFTGSYSEDFNTWPKEDDPGVVEGFSLPWTDNNTKLGWYQGLQLAAGGPIIANTELLIGQAPGLRTLKSLGMPFDTERAIGSGISNETGSAPITVFWGFRLQNDSGHVIDALDLEFDVENWQAPRTTGSFIAEQNITLGQYRVGGSDFGLSDFVNASQLNLTSVMPVVGLAGPLNGNLPENRTHVTASLSSLNWQVGESLWIRWQDVNNTGRDAVFGIDNLSVTEAAPVPEPATLLLLGVGSGLLALRRKKRS